MKSYLLTWKPQKSRWADKVPLLMEKVEKNGIALDNWRCMNKNATVGDRVFLLKQGHEPRGIVASGWVASKSYSAPHWNPEAADTTTDYIDINFDVVLSGSNSENIFARERLDAAAFAGVHWNTQASGILIHAPQAEQLEKEWAHFLKEKNIQQGCARPLIELDGTPTMLLQEGKVKQSFTNAYERNPQARALCLKHHGISCAVCGFNFGDRYGLIGEGYIHVHHLTPLSEIGEEHGVDPIKDLRPVCPNCHAMLHSRMPMLSIEELKKMLR